jgi:SAM-dependent methyltransferase
VTHPTAAPAGRPPGSSRAEDLLDGQRRRWETMLRDHERMFGPGPSLAARAAARLFARHGVRRVVELGAGQGRDALFFAALGFEVAVVDYAAAGIDATVAAAETAGLAGRITPVVHDVRAPLPLPDGSVDACYSHMLLCMALTREQQDRICAQVWRLLRPGGLHVFTGRTTRDPHYGRGRHHGEDLYETGGVIVHFLSDASIDRFAAGWRGLERWDFEEGPLPRRLCCLALQRPTAPPSRQRTTTTRTRHATPGPGV